MFTVKNKKDRIPVSSFLRKQPSWRGMGALGTYTGWLCEHLPEWTHDELSWEILMFKCIGTVLIWNSNDHPRSGIWIFNGSYATGVVLRHPLELVKFIQDSTSAQGVRDGQREEFNSQVAWFICIKQYRILNLNLLPDSVLSYRIMFWSSGVGRERRGASKGAVWEGCPH